MEHIEVPIAQLLADGAPVVGAVVGGKLIGDIVVEGTPVGASTNVGPTLGVPTGGEFGFVVGTEHDTAGIDGFAQLAIAPPVRTHAIKAKKLLLLQIVAWSRRDGSVNPLTSCPHAESASQAVDCTGHVTSTAHGSPPLLVSSVSVKVEVNICPNCPHVSPSVIVPAPAAGAVQVT